MKPHVALMLLAALAGCSEPTANPPVERDSVEIESDPSTEIESDPSTEIESDPSTEIESGSSGEIEAQPIYDKPQLVYYRINKH